MKRLLIPFWAILLLLVTACAPDIGGAAGPAQQSRQANPGHISQQATSRPTSPAPLVQQSLPKGLLNSTYPVMDWVFNRTCSQSVTSYSQNQMDATIAYDSAAWLYPSDGHLVEGSQDCDNNALISQARTLGLPTLLTVGVDSYWSAHDLAQYIDQASTQPQVPCTAQATTFICTIVNWVVRGGYSGVIIDFEIVQGEYPGIRQKFAAFLRKLQDALHQQGKLCGVALIHKIGDTSATDPSAPLNSFQDWTLLRGLDFLVDMVLDFDLPLKQPGPLVSIPWLDKQLQYLSSTAPDITSKIIWEFPLYGREWRQDANGTWSYINDVTCQQAMTLKATHSLLSDVTTDPTTPEIAWDDQNGSRHELWYNTPSSLLAIMTHLQQQLRNMLNSPTYKLPVSFWYRGAECANFFGAGHILQGFYNAEAAGR